MAYAVTYAGNFGGVAGSNGLTATLSATSAITSVPSGAVITAITYSLRIKAGGYSSSESWILNRLAVGGSDGSPSAYANATMYDSEHTFSGSMDFYASDVSKFDSDTITVYAKAQTTHSSTSYLWEVSITVEYTFPENCEPPTKVTINGKTGTVNAPGGTVTLAWSGAKAGSGNKIRGYLICSYDSTDGGKTWKNYQVVKEVKTSATSGSTSVSSPAVGARRKFTITTCSAYGSVYDSMDSAESPVVIGGHEPLEGFTDATLTAEATPVKALHMQELQARVDTLRAFYGLSAYNFTTIIAGQTSLAGWTSHVLEIRAAIDEIGMSHAAWLTITENKPRADVIQQLRDVVLSL